MKFLCTDCSLKLNLKEKNLYTCPNCGSIMVKEKHAKKFSEGPKNKLEDYKKKIDKEKINEILNEEEKIKNKAEKKALESVKKYIYAFFALLKDPQAQWQHKVIAAAALLYLISPVDLIPDFIPFAGFLDDAVIIFIAAKNLNIAIKKYLNENPKNVLDEYDVNETLFYFFKPQNSNFPYEYTENEKIRMLHLHDYGLEKYNLNIINDNLLKLPELYVGHPHFYKTLIPFNNYDQIIVDDILQEEINLLAAFGAKTINYTIHDFEMLSKNVNINTQLCEGIINGEIEAENKNIKYTKEVQKYKFNESKQYDINFINNLVWYFTFENTFKNIIRQRILHGIKYRQFKVEKNTKNFLNLNTRAKVIGKGKIDTEINTSNIIHRQIDFEVDFHPLTKNIKENPQKFWGKLKRKINNRKKILTDKYKKINLNENVKSFY